MEAFKEVESSEMGGMRPGPSELVSVEASIAPRTISGSPDEKMKIVLNGMQLIMNVLYKSQPETLEVNTSSTSF